MKLTHVKLANAIKIGTKEMVFVHDPLYSITLDGFNVRVECNHTKDVTFTSLFNTISWKADESERSANPVLPGTQPKSGKAKN